MAKKTEDLDNVIFVRVSTAKKKRLEEGARKRDLHSVAAYVRQALEAALAQDGVR
jgi:hypothetical protein